MRYLSITVALCILIGENLVCDAKNPLGPGYTINFTGGVTIDGNVDDWGNAEWVTYGAATIINTGGTDWNGTDAVCTFAMLYNEEALFCAARVEDDVHSFADGTTPYAWWERDGIQWFIDFTNIEEQEILYWPDLFQNFENNPNANWLPGEMIIAIGAVEDQTDHRTRQWPVGTRDGDRSDWNDFTLPDGTVIRGENNEQWESTVIFDGANYTVEVKIPWSSLEKSNFYSDPDDPTTVSPDSLNQLGWEPLLPDPLPGSTIGFTHLCIDVDLPAGGFDSQVMWVGTGDDDKTWTEATFSEETQVQNWEIQ